MTEPIPDRSQLNETPITRWAGKCSMSELTGEEIVRRIVSDKGALKELIHHIVSDPDMRMAVISAVLLEVATKQDIREVRQELRQEMNQVRTEMNQLREELNQLRRDTDMRFDELRREMRSLIRWTITTILVVWGSTVLPVMLRVAGLI